MSYNTSKRRSSLRTIHASNAAGSLEAFRQFMAANLQNANNYTSERKSIPLAGYAAEQHDKGSQNMKKFARASQYMNHSAAKHFKNDFINTDSLYRTEYYIKNPNAQKKLEFGGEDYSDLLERDEILKKFAQEVFP